MTEPVDISVLIPCLNESENVVQIAEAVASELEAAQVTYDILFIDNGSTDATVELVKRLCAGDPRIRLIVNNRNFGQLRSPTYGIYQTTGRAVIGISADFQDPPQLIGALVERWRAGVHIVLGVRESENSSFVLKFIRAIGYGFFSRFGDYRVIPGATGFGLYDRDVVDCLKAWRDPEPFFRGMLVESGYSLETIPYHRPQRAGGITKNSLATLLSFAVSGLANSSKKILRFPIYLSFLFFLGTAVFAVLSLVSIIAGGPAGALAISSLSLLVLGAIFFFLGLLGEQVRLITEMARGVPLVTEKERVNFPPD